MTPIRSRFPFMAFVLLAVTAMSSLLTAACSAQDRSKRPENWAQFRGPNSAGVSTATDLPTHWSETRNLKWRLRLAGVGASSPIVWGNRVFVTSHSGYGEDPQRPAGDPQDLTRHLVCVDRDSGRILWKKDVRHQGAVRTYHPLLARCTYAAHTPVTDGETVYCFFGSHGVVAFDFEGRQIWKTDSYEVSESKYGSGASPTLFEDLILVNASFEGDVFLALDKQTGREVWRRRVHSRGFTTPVIARTATGPIAVLQGSRGVSAFNPRTGEIVWQFPHGGRGIPLPIFDGKRLYTFADHRPLMCAALDPNQRGQLKTSAAVWTVGGGVATCSPVLYEGLIYVYDHTFRCLRADTGEELYNQRINTRSNRPYASLFAADGKIYVPGKYPNCWLVIKAGPEFEVLSLNEIQSNDDSEIVGSMAVSGGKLLFRTHKVLYCIGKS